ncbi:MAG TPA: methyltransferase domain-containing protein [Acidimicrobiia bacterium]|nr:methyltransferase domain-containing protein [Acidimicrobiia bacterium]
MAGSDPRPSGWRSYDSVADAYDQAAVPRFLPLARDLVAAVAPREDARILDVGTGTGVAAQVAREGVGPAGFIVGIDPSIAMLGRALDRGVTIAAGMLPGLPFPEAAFDAVLANLVLSHLNDCKAGLDDAFRVLRPGGRFGCSAWGPDAPAEGESDWVKADEIFESLAVAQGIDVTPPTPPVPSEEKIRPRGNLEAVLRGAGLVDVEVQPHIYHWTSSIEGYLVGRDWRPRARYMRQQADDRAWRDIQDRAAAELRGRFGETIRSVGQLWVAVGTKP